MSMTMKGSLAAGICALAIVAGGTEYFVDRTRPDDSGAGTSEATAKRTIQAAVDAAAAGDIVTVLPGVYDEGYGTYTDTNAYSFPLTNRVSITKQLTLRSRDGAAVTHIVGAPDRGAIATNSASLGVGQAAIRGIYATKAGTVIRGFTIRDGCAHILNLASDCPANQGGGVRSGIREVYVVDCVVSNCVGTRGGAFRHCTAVRCRIADNLTASGTAVGRDSDFVNCFILRNRCPNNINGNHVLNCNLYNCTCVENADTPFVSTGVHLYNTILVNNDRQAANGGYVDPAESHYCSARHSVLESNRAGSKYLFDVYDCVVDASPYQFLASLFGDWRLLPSSAAVGLGDPAHLGAVSLPEGVDAYVDIEGRAIPRTGRINAGAFQSIGPEPAGGVQVLNGEPDVSGKCAHVEVPGVYANCCTNALYAFATEEPFIFRARIVPPAGYHVFDVSHPSCSSNRYECPLMDDTIHLATPPRGVTLVSAPRVTANAVWVDPVNGVDAAGHGTEASPFRTLQYAVDATPNNARSVVYAAAGEYAEGGAFYGGVTNRLAIHDKHYVRVKGAGRGKSIIRGRHDDPSASQYGDGRGPGAIRCLYGGNAPSFVQGFTLADGATLDGKDDAASRKGGAFYTSNGNTPGLYTQLYDSTITNCTAYRGSAVIYARIVRCEVTGCDASSGGLVRYTSSYSSILHDNHQFPDLAEGHVLGGNGYARQCTSFGGPGVCALDANSIPTVNCIAVPIGTTPKRSFSAGIYGCLFGPGLTDSTSGAPGRDWVTDLPAFVDVAAHDYRLLACSPAVTCGVADDYWNFPVSDYYGNPLRFVNGRPMAGAVHELPMSCAVVKSGGGTMTCSPAITNVLEAGQSVNLQVTYTPDPTRQFLGMLVNGATQDVTTVSCTFTAPAEASKVFVVEPLDSPHWYVNPDPAVGDDANDGFTPQTAKRTLVGVMAAPGLRSGDTVHAAPGVYDQGSVTVDVNCGGSGQNTTPARVHVAAGITLVADEGPEKTVIRGEETVGATLGLGDDSVRCVSMVSGGVLRGFTLTFGHTTLNGSGEHRTYCGGAVIANVPGDTSWPLIENCIITNNFAQRAGAGQGGRYVNCLIADNHSNNANPSSIGRAGAVNCLIADNTGGSEVVRFPSGFDNCTMLANWYDHAKTTRAKVSVQDYRTYNKPIANSVFLVGFDIDYAANRVFKAYNCVFPSDLPTRSYAYTNCFNCVSNTLANLKVGADGHLLPGSPAIDFGDSSRIPYDGARCDLGGGQRVYNGTVDAGCYEYDWRSVYAADLSEKGEVACAAASENVTESANDTVLVPVGEKLEIVLQGVAAGSTARCEVPLEMTGTGFLDVTLNGEPLATFTEADGSTVLKFKSAAAENRLVFDCTGYGASGVAEIGAITRRVPGFSINFR